jgi:hypothetical protein
MQTRAARRETMFYGPPVAAPHANTESAERLVITNTLEHTRSPGIPTRRRNPWNPALSTFSSRAACEENSHHGSGGRKEVIKLSGCRTESGPTRSTESGFRVMDECVGWLSKRQKSKRVRTVGNERQAHHTGSRDFAELQPRSHKGSGSPITGSFSEH